MQKILKFEREHTSNENPLLHNVFGSPVKKANTPVKKAVQGKKSDIAKKIVKNHEKNKFVKFPTKIKENVAFFTVCFFYQAFLVAPFIPFTVFFKRSELRVSCGTTFLNTYHSHCSLVAV